jgi:predicted DNA-binding protein with PD1-like motif
MIVSRLLPGDDLKTSLENISEGIEFNSGVIVSVVGSLTKTHLRMSNGTKKLFEGFFEIVSVEGTISADGVHIHMAVSDENGSVYGGHLLEGCIIHTTAEVCVIEAETEFRRVFDQNTGYNELHIQ